MPFTPFHLGPALAIDLPLRNGFHAPTFIVANMTPDIEPFIVVYFNVYYYPLHGYAHTFLGALIGFLTSLSMYASRKTLYDFSKLITREQKLSAYILAGLSGTSLHVLFDSPLYDDIKPLYPIDINPFFNPSLTPFIYDVCKHLFLLGFLIYLVIINYKLSKYYYVSLKINNKN